MAADFQRPGAYVQETPTGVRTIVAAPTAVTAFVGPATRGPTDQAVRIQSSAAFDADYGGLDAGGPLAHAVSQFFANGGQDAWVVRVAPQAVAAAISLRSAADPEAGTAVLTARASSEGAWGNALRLVVDYETADPERLFNLTVIEMAQRGGAPVMARSEAFRDLSMDAAAPNPAVAVVNATSRLIRLEAPDGQAMGVATRPAAAGSAWARLDPAFDFAGLDAPGALVVDILDPADTVVHHEVLPLWPDAASRPTDRGQFLARLQAAFAASARAELASARIRDADGRMRFTLGGGDPALRLQFAAGPTSGDGAIDLAADAAVNVGAYQLGVGPALAAQGDPVRGDDGRPPTPADILGARDTRTGLFALEAADGFNILVLPDQSDAGLQAAALAYAEARRAFAILDLPAEVDTPDRARAWLAAADLLRSPNAAAYFPRIRLVDPAGQIRAFANAGAIAGLYARTDMNCGVWKAPAGLDAVLKGRPELDVRLTDQEAGALNSSGLNMLRVFPGSEPVVWGARTLAGADGLGAEWKYVPVRRLALFIEESLLRGLQWTAFQPNDEALWSQIRLNVSAFLQGLFRQGAFQGATARDAYSVHCDGATAPPADAAEGIVDLSVGFAPLKPREFLHLRLRLPAGRGIGWDGAQPHPDL